MEIAILEESKDVLKIKIIGETHTIPNELRKELWNDSHVTVSGYSLEHPLIGSPVLILETDGKEDARKSLSGAIERIKKRNKELRESFNRAIGLK